LVSGKVPPEREMREMRRVYMDVYLPSSSAVGTAGGCRISGSRNWGGRMEVRIQAVVVFAFSAVFCAAVSCQSDS